MPLAARKCTTCGEYQNAVWRIAAGIDLKGLIALIPIATLAYSYLQDRLQPARSDLRLALVACTSTGVDLFASNVGNRAAIVQGASFRTNDLAPQPLVLDMPLNSRLIEGGGTRSLVLQADQSISPGGMVPFSERDKSDCTVRISIETIAFDHELEARRVSCDCPD